MACGAPIDDSELDGLFDKPRDWKETQYIVIRLLKQFLFRDKAKSSKREPQWLSSFFPYDPSLIHWDAVDDNYSQDPEKISDLEVRSKVENFRNKEIFLKPTRGNKEELALPFIRTNLLRNGGRVAFLFVKTDKNKEKD